MVEIKRRRSFEAGHRLKFMVLVDETPECDRAVHFAVRRAARLGARVVMLAVAEPPETMEWLGVGDAMRAEAEAETMRAWRRSRPRRGRPRASIPNWWCAPASAPTRSCARSRPTRTSPSWCSAPPPAATGRGPSSPRSPGGAGSFPVPVVIVPGALSEAEITALAG